MNYRPEIKQAQTDGITMDYFVFGEGRKTFVMLPGLSLGKITLSAQSVASVYRQFGEDYTVYVFERKNDVEEGYSIEAMAEDTAKVMKHIGISDAYVFGVSQGGMIAQCLAAEHPELVKKLLLASAVCRECESSASVVGEWTALAKNGETEKLVESFLDSIYSNDFIKKYKKALIMMFRDTPPDELRRFYILAAACVGIDFSSELSKIRCPVLVLGAKHDKVFSADEFRFIAEKTGGEIYLYDEFGHAVYDEAPDFKERIAAFFNK